MPDAKRQDNLTQKLKMTSLESKDPWLSLNEGAIYAYIYCFSQKVLFVPFMHLFFYELGRFVKLHAKKEIYWGKFSFSSIRCWCGTKYAFFVAAGISSPEQELLTRYLLSRILEKEDASYPDHSQDKPDQRIGQRRDDQDSSPSIVYPQVSQQVKILLFPLWNFFMYSSQSLNLSDVFFKKPKKILK